PKQFLPLFRGRSLFQLTLERIRPLVRAADTLVVCGVAHLDPVRRQARSLPRRQILVEERGRNTAASIALAALRIRRRLPDAVMVVLPSDHWVRGSGAFRATLRRAVRAVRRSDGLLTLGVQPRGPDTG